MPAAELPHTHTRRTLRGARSCSSSSSTRASPPAYLSFWPTQGPPGSSVCLRVRPGLGWAPSGPRGPLERRPPAPRSAALRATVSVSPATARVPLASAAVVGPQTVSGGRPSRPLGWQPATRSRVSAELQWGRLIGCFCAQSSSCFFPLWLPFFVCFFAFPLPCLPLASRLKSPPLG